MSLHDVTTEMVVALGAVDRLVGISEPVDVSPEVQRAVVRVARVGGAETILSVRPSVVLGLTVVEEQDPELVSRLRRDGIEVYLADPQTLDSVYALTRAVAERVHAFDAGERVATRLREQATEETSRPERPLRVFVYDCCDPPFTAGGKTVLSDLIHRAGGRNIFADLDTDWTNVSWEEVVSRRPELIVIHAYKLEGQGDVPDKQRALRAIPSLGELPTTVVPLGCSLGGLRSLEGLQLLRTAIRDHS